METSDVLKTEEEEESTADGYKNSPNADITVMFTKPVGNGLGMLFIFTLSTLLIKINRFCCNRNLELPIGKDVHFLVGFLNKGDKDFYVDTMDASFRYSADFSYYLQNVRDLTLIIFNFKLNRIFQIVVYSICLQSFSETKTGSYFKLSIFCQRCL